MYTVQIQLAHPLYDVHELSPNKVKGLLTLLIP